MNRTPSSGGDSHLATDVKAPSASTPLHVLMIGEGLERQGGIVTVQKLILAMAGDDLRFSHLATLKDGSALMKTFVFMAAVGRLIKHLLTDHIDLVHIHVSIGGSVYRQVVTGGITLLAGRPLIMHAHAGEFPEFFERLSSPMRWLTKLVFRHADRLVVLSPHWQKVYGGLIGLPPGRMAVLTNPVNPPKTVPSRAERTTVRLLYLGRISQPKGAFDLLHAVGDLPADVLATVQMTVAGDGDVDAARHLVARLGLEQQIDVLDWVCPTERDALLAKTDIFLLPSYFEGMPMALLEAMSWGLVSVATPVGGIPDVVTDGVNGVLVPAGDRQRLTQAIDALVRNPERRQQLGAAARENMQLYTIERYASALRKLYADVKSRQSDQQRRPA